MLTSKQRAALRAMAAAETSVTQLGKSGINDAFIEGIDKAIEKRELIKITVLENSGLTPREAAEEIEIKISAECVCVTGRKLVFYRRSSSDKVKHIEIGC